MKRIILALLVIAFIGCGREDSISKAAKEIGMRPSEFQAAIEMGPLGILEAQKEYDNISKTGNGGGMMDLGRLP